MDDKDLVRAIILGNRHAFKQLIEQHKHLIGHMIAKLIDDPLEREELCQDVFIKVYNSISTFKGESKLSTWIATIAYRMAVNRLRTLKRSPEMDDIDKINFQHGETSDKLGDVDFSKFIHSLIDKMPLNYRTVLTLYYIEGFSYLEIMKVTELPEGTVKNYLFRAKNKLKELVTPYIGTEIER
ncbi:MAG: RNA polymerase sigma factor (sigma-70 family) [Marinoscillum sp.]|jgi:RNA polymerase sigma factor (sigma-70 family)